MDRKEKSLLDFYYGKILDHTFDEKDVYAFLVLLRNQSTEIRCINELADFIAYRGKKEGFIKEYLLETRQKFERLGKVNTPIRIEDVFSFREVKSAINKALMECQLKGLENEQINNILICILSLLQHIPILDKGREIGMLFLAISTKQVLLMAEVEIVQNGNKKSHAVFPVMTANNHYHEIKKQDKYDTPYFFDKNILEIANNQGKLEITILK